MEARVIKEYGIVKHWRRRNRWRRKPFHYMMILGQRRRKRFPVPLLSGLEVRYRIFMVNRRALHYKATYAEEDTKDYAWRLA